MKQKVPARNKNSNRITEDDSDSAKTLFGTCMYAQMKLLYI